MSSQNRIRCAVAAVLVAAALLAATPAEAAGWGGNDLSGLLERVWQRLAGWLPAPAGDPAPPGGLRGIFENADDGPHVDPNGVRLNGDPQPGSSQE